MQGRVIAALADNAVVLVIYSLVKDWETFNTVEMKINVLGAVKEGDVKAEAHIAKQGRTISLGEFILCQGELIVAKGLCTCIHLAQR